jgi:predicted amidophosphoribosyltransferase
MPRTKKVESIIKSCDDEKKFPYETFPYRLETKEGKTKKVCWFSHESHVHKYIERHKLAKKDYVAECFDNLY